MSDPLSHHTESLETCLRHRHSIRFYKPDPVARATLDECLSLAQLAPSNSNIQNWRLHIASGAARDRIVTALSAEAQAHGPNIPALPDQFRHYRSELGHHLYGADGYGISRAEKDKMTWAQQRNFAFFDAPTVAVLSMDRTLQPVDAMSVGMFVQTFMLALTERGLGSILLVSVTGYPEVLRREFGLPEDQLVLCGMAIGWPAEKNKVNELVVPREELAHSVTYLEE